MRFNSGALTFLIAHLFAISISVAAQNNIERTWRGPDLALIRTILAEADNSSKPDAKRSTTNTPVSTANKLARFKPGPDPGIARSLADAFGRSPAEIANLKDAFDSIKQGYETEVAKEGKSNNVAAALTFFISTNAMVFHDAPEPPDAVTEEMFQNVEKLIESSPSFAKITDPDKQQMHDWLVMMAGFALINYQDNKKSNNAEGLRNIGEFANLATKVVLGKGLDESRIATPQATKTSETAPTRTAGANASGITLSTTTFNDGWTAVIDSDAVHLTKGPLDVYLFWPIQFTDETRNLDTADLMWRTVVVPRFNVRSAQKFEDQIPDFLERLYYYEGTGTDKRTGKNAYIAMKAVSVSGFSKVIVATAPDKAAYKAAFPEPKSLTPMLNANRFALSAGDLVGTWKGMEGNSLMYYNSNTGNYAGMSTVAVSDEFTFESGGGYSSKHAQGSTQFGVTQGGQQRYTGRATVSNWELTLTNRYNGRAETFTASFEALKGGRILHLTKKDATGIQFHLVKTQ